MNIINILIKLLSAAYTAEAKRADAKAQFNEQVPVLQHLFRSVLLEVDQLKQLDLITLRGEDQLMLFAIEAQLEGNFIKNQIQGVLHLGHEFCAAGMIFVLIHHLAQFCFHLGKGFPPVLCPLPEALHGLFWRGKYIAGGYSH